jgi:hypothetical protein
MLWFSFVANCIARLRSYRKSMSDSLPYHTNCTAVPVALSLRPVRGSRKIKIVIVPYRPTIGERTMRLLQSAWWAPQRIYISQFA